MTALADVVGPNHVLTDPELTASYETDWTGRFVGRAAAVVRPGTTDEVAAVMALLHEAGRPVVPQGGNTGLVGGSVPLHGEVVVSLRRLAAIDPVDVAAGQVTAGAGATLAAVDAAATGAGLAFGVDLAARDSATVGGMVATNAGGLRMLRYGGMRAQMAGVEAVLADGRVLSHLGGLAKDNTGYDLAGLLAGSEGTLAVVTRPGCGWCPGWSTGRRACWPSPTPSRPRGAGRAAPPAAGVAGGGRAVPGRRGRPGVRPPRDPAAVRPASTRSTCWSRWPASTTRPRSWPRPSSTASGTGPSTAPSSRIRRAGPGCGATGRRTPRRSTPPACRSSST